MISKMDNFIKLEDIQFICDIMSNTFMLPVYFLDKEGNILFENLERYLGNPATPNKTYVLKSLIQNNNVYNFPIIKTNSYYETFFYISIKDYDTFIGTFIVGPSISSKVSLEVVDELIATFNIPFNYKKNLFNYYNSLPVISIANLLNFILTLYYSIFHKKLDIEIIKEKNHISLNDLHQMDNSLDQALSNKRINTNFHTPYRYEQIIIQSIKEGNYDKLLEIIHNPPSGEFGSLSKRSPVRNNKNFFIVICTIATRVAIEVGLSFEVAYTLSDQYIQQVEDLNTVEEVTTLSMKMLFDFTNRIKSVKNKKSHSKCITKCENYILDHLYENITLSQLSELVNLNPNYLSESFSKEVGVSISNYIQIERVNEAKKLLVITDHSLSEIYVLLNFASQSYFSTVFKKITGITPKQYRDMNKMS